MRSAAFALPNSCPITTPTDTRTNTYTHLHTHAHTPTHTHTHTFSKNHAHPHNPILAHLSPDSSKLRENLEAGDTHTRRLLGCFRFRVEACLCGEKERRQHINLWRQLGQRRAPSPRDAHSTGRDENVADSESAGRIWQYRKNETLRRRQPVGEQADLDEVTELR